jgi:hypothetical protein
MFQTSLRLGDMPLPPVKGLVVGKGHVTFFRKADGKSSAWLTSFKLKLLLLL